MKRVNQTRLWCCVGLLAGLLAGCGGGDGGGGGGGYGGGPGGPGGGGGSGTSYTAKALVSDGASTTYKDANLVNGWGVAFNPAGFVWVSDNGTSKSTLYDGNGVPQSLVVGIPAGTVGSASPTGIVFNGSQDFKVSQGGGSGASAFLFVGEAGTLSGWSPSVNQGSAITVYDGGSAGKRYTGLALLNQGGSNLLFAADFHNGKIDVFDSSFAQISVMGGFKDANLPAGYAPYNIQALGGQLYVTYAKQDAKAEDSTVGAGLGLVDVFDGNGSLLKRLVSGEKLNAPWGLAMAPTNFGPYSGMLLVGNFGDGKINAYDPASGAYKGTLSKTDGSALVIEGLWGIAFGNGLNSQPLNTLFYAAGPGDESHGVYGRIDLQ
ncbi:TIGR03118 family protein [Chitinimonas sp.]|uniref:TIGR03118 family protein n=1 Tax=Chitinimonas sp. TaxID=1934313 RepID=UPI002F956B4A